MALILNYWLEYFDTVNVKHRVEIYKDTSQNNFIKNGDFGTLEYWNLGAGWAINTGLNRAEYDGLGVNFGTMWQTDLVFQVGTTYRVTYTLESISGGNCRFRFFGGGTQLFGTERTVAGTYFEDVTIITNNATEFQFNPESSSVAMNIKDVSVTLVPDAVVETEVQGFASLKYSSADNHLVPIRGSGLQLSLEANLDLTFEDLYSDQERTFAVKYFRDGIVTFDGWLNPDGLYQDFVKDRWIITLVCVDGIGYLTNLTFLDPIAFAPVKGRQTALFIIKTCLLRTSVYQNINISVDIYYDGLGETLDIMDNILLRAGRYVKLDLATIMSCREVMNDLLEIFGACIASVNGEWFIYKPNQLALNSTQTFFRYDSDGVALAPATKDVDLAVTLGSQINNFYPHHAGENQSMGTAPSLGAYRIEYKYGLTQSLLDNTNLQNNSITINKSSHEYRF